MISSALVFCGANTGSNPIYTEIARQVGQILAKKNKKIVYGAGKVGLMGIVAEAALQEQGEVIGVIPFFLRKKEVCHESLSQLFVVDSMHERKVKMAQLSDAVIVLPGGYGTMDELFEMLTLAQLGQGQHPVSILNVNGFYDPLIAQLDKMVEEGFLKSTNRIIAMVSNSVEEMIEQLENYIPAPVEGKWIKL